MRLNSLLKKTTRWPVRAVAGTLRSVSGVASLELALLLPALVLLVVGVFDYGLVIHQKTQLAHAARAGVQYALIRRPQEGDLDGVETAVNDTAPVDTTGTRVIDADLWCECPETPGTVVSCEITTCNRSVYIWVSIEEDYNATFYEILGISNPIHIKNEATLRLN